MIHLKSEEEVELIRQSSLLVGRTLAEVARIIGPGVTTLAIDRRAEEFIRDNGAKPGFKGYNGFPNTLCVSVNEVVVHGIPGSRELKDGDIVSVDCGALLNGFYGDSAFTFLIGEVDPEVVALVAATRESLDAGIEKAVSGNRIGDIGYAVQTYVEPRGYSVVRDLTGHGLGRHLHEDPMVPNYGRRGTGTRLQPGMVLAIEPMINLGTKSVILERDGWAFRTTDRKPSAHFEHDVVIRQGKAEVLSTFEFIDEVLKSRKLNYGKTAIN